MSDRELLELAAKAAGYQSCGMYEDGRIYLLGIQTPWSPLTCDGDALRLAVKLRITIEYSYGGIEVRASWRMNKIFAGNVVEEIGSLCNGDEPNAATRRAIVRAAAEIGKAMP